MNKKPNIWDSKLLADTYVITGQMQVQIEMLLRQLEVQHISDIPHSMVPTKTLYEIVLCNDLMYNILLEKNLIESGNKKQESKSLH